MARKISLPLSLTLSLSLSRLSVVEEDPVLEVQVSLHVQRLGSGTCGDWDQATFGDSDQARARST